MTIHRTQLFLVTVAVGLAAAVTGPAAAHGGSYVVRQCDAGAGAEDAEAVARFSAYSVKDACRGNDGALKVDNVDPASDEHYGLWRFVAPAGTALAAVRVDAALASAQRHHPAVYLSGPAGVFDRLSEGDSAGWDRLEWAASGQPRATILAARLRCSTANGVCDESPAARAWMRDVRLTLLDSAPPALDLSGELVAGAWRSATSSFGVAVTDDGGGARRVEVSVNGEQVATRTFGCKTIGESTTASRLRPCPPVAEAQFSLDTAAAPFREGVNDLLVCAEDYGPAGSNRTCAARSVAVDNDPPAAPIGLAPDGGGGWSRSNEFDLGWANPVAGAAPVVAAHYRLETEQGETVSGPARLAGAGVERLEDVVVPKPGRYRLRLWLEDEAGNASESTAASAWLRFDDVPPGPVNPVMPSGWLSAEDLAVPYVQRWSAPGDVPVSGIAGYAVAVDRAASTNPCDTPGDPDPAVCMPAEVTHDRERLAETLAWLPDGTSFVHVAAVSGSGLRSGSVAHVAVRADREAPATELIGAPAGWVAEPVTLVVRATDALSGMAPSLGDDGEPGVAATIDGAPGLNAGGDELTLELEADGDHLVRYWARDLAGNTSAAASARVRIDRSAPVVAFRSRQDPGDPELVRASVTDEVSGAASGSIAYRRAGEDAWQPLATDLRDGELVARMPSDRLADGIYELRASASDRAGNSAATGLREDGGEMLLELPLKTVTSVRAALGSGSRRLRVEYGASPLVFGRLVDASGEPLAGAAVELEERFAPGSLDVSRSRTLVISAAGRFEGRLPRGPSRSVVVRYEGSAGRLAATSAALRLQVAARARMRATERRPPVGRRFGFVGRVGHRGAAVPAGGKLVELQVARPEGWDTVRQAFRTRPDGSWRFPFRFGDYYLEPTTFRFRLKVLRESDWPYRPTATRTERVTVIPRR